MNKARITKIEEKSLITTMFRSNYFAIFIGLIFVIVTLLLWNSTENESSEQLSRDTETFSEIYASNIEQRIDNIDFGLNELAGYGYPDTLEKENDWETRTSFYVQNLDGVDNIVLVDENLIIRKSMPSVNEKYTINSVVTSEENNSSFSNLVIPVYNDDILTGFVIGNINVPKLILSISLEFEEEYMIQVFDDSNFLASSDNWIESADSYSSEMTVTFNDKTFHFVVTPTSDVVDSSDSTALSIRIFGLFLSIIVTGLILFLQYIRKNSIVLKRNSTDLIEKNDLLEIQKKQLNNAGEKLESLVEEKTAELRLAIVKLKDEKELAQNYLNIAGVMMMTLDINGTVRLMNKKGCSIIGLDEKEIIGKNWVNNFIPERLRTEIKQLFDSIFDINATIPEKYENVILTSNGDERLISWDISLVYDDNDNRIGILSSGEDITEKVQKQTRILEVLDLLDRTQEIGKIGTWELDLKTNLVWASQEAFNIYGLVRDTEYLDLYATQQMIIIEDREDATNNLYETIKSEGSYDYHYTIDTGSLSKKIHAKANVIRDDIGQAIKVMGFVRDETEEYEKTAELVRAQLLLKASINSQNTVVMASLDRNYNYIFFNKTHEMEFKEIYNKQIENGKCIFDYMTSKDDIKRAKENYDIALSGVSHKKLEQYGTTVTNYYESQYSPIKNDVNEIIGVFILTENISERIGKEQEIKYLSYHDQLTGLYNRRYFEEQKVKLDNPRNLPLSIIMGDVNGLKLINDAFGHLAGDKLLKMIGNIISTSIRGNDIAARWGGDEFAILLPSSDIGATEKLITRINKKVQESSFEFGKVSISFGSDTKVAVNENLYDVFDSAEKLMYQSKLSEVDSVRGETINTIMNTLFEKSEEVRDHSTRVSDISVLIAVELGLSKTSVNDIKTMGMIHDIGKIIIDLNILDKPEKLTNEERAIIQQHPLSGSRMLNSSHEYSRLAVGVLHHHERIDGTGYPNGISGDQIPIESKIIAIADAYDAMTAARPYRLNPLSVEEAIEELKENSGTQFDKDIVDVFITKVLIKKD